MSMRSSNPSVWLEEKMTRFLGFALLFVFFQFFAISNGEKLAIIMLDGFRWDYPGRMTVEEMPYMKKLISEGTAADYVQPIFPSVSFPSWTTIVTGLYPESHGIIGNYMFDEKTNKTFNIEQISTVNDTTDDTIWWTKHVPLWISSTQTDKKTSLYLWSRCDVAFNEILPARCVPYDRESAINLTIFEDNLKQGVEDLKNGFELVFLFYGNVDNIGHVFGPDTTEMLHEMIDLDVVLGSFLDGLEEGGLREQTNVVILTDHGMTEVTDKTFSCLPLSDELSANINLVVDRGPFTFISLTNKSLLDATMIALQNMTGMEAYTKNDIPERLHLKEDEKVLDILLVTAGTKMVWTKTEATLRPNCQLEEVVYLPPPYSGFDVGMHGWDDTSYDSNAYLPGNYPDMRGIFIGNGPNFKRGLKHQWIKLVDEYQIFTHLLGIEGEPNNGTWERVQGMLNSGNMVGGDNFTLLIVALLLAFYNGLK